MLQVNRMYRKVKYSLIFTIALILLDVACGDSIIGPYDGQWEEVSVPEDIGYDTLWFTGPNDGWVAGKDVIGHYDGSEWKVIREFNTEGEEYRFRDIIAKSPNDVWACGRVVTGWSEYHGFIAHYDGTDWDVQHFMEVSFIEALWLFEDGTGWAGGNGLLYYDGKTWTYYGSSIGGDGFYFSAPDDGWMISYTGIFRWNGSTWTLFFNSWHTHFVEIDFAAPDDGWAVGELDSYHYDGTEWKLYEPLKYKDFDAVHFLNENFGWGINGNAYYYDGSAWTDIDEVYGYSKYDVFCVSENDVWITTDSDFFFHFKGFYN